MKPNQPYAYLLEDIATGRKYIGCRFAKGCDPSDLGVSYFTSSVVVSELFKSEPERFLKSILMTGTAEEVIEFEKKLIDDCNAVINDGYYNRTSGRAIHPDDRLAGAYKEHAKRSPELYAELVARMHAKTTFEQRSKAATAYAESIRGPKLDAKMEMMRSKKTPESTARGAAKNSIHALANLDRMSNMGKVGGKLGGPKGCLVTNSQKWKCIECGMISLPGPLGKHQSRSKHSGKERVL